MRTTLLALAFLALAAAPAPAQGWAQKLFKDGDKDLSQHDFGGVPRGGQLLHRFPITNIYAVRLEITNVRTSCGCVTVAPSKRVLEPREKATVDVTIDTRRFTGPKTFSVHVSVGPEYVSTAELKVTANSRADVVFNPGDVDFGVVQPGQTPKKTIDVEYAGALDWRVSEVKAKDAPLAVELKEIYRRPGQVGYSAEVTLKPDVPPGKHVWEVLLTTNDPAGKTVPFLVEATVEAGLSVSPSPLKLEGLKAGEAVEKKVRVRGDKPFRVVSVDGLKDGVTLVGELPREAAAVHTLTIKCQPAQAGSFRRQLQIKTDRQEAPLALTVEGEVGPAGG